MWWLLLSSVLAGPALAAPDAAVGAERDRILAELHQLEARGVWKGVDRSYRELERILARGVLVSAEAHLAGAEAARTLGDISALVTRLERADAEGADVHAALASVRQRFTRVHLVAPRRLGADLEATRNPFELDARRAIEVARDALETTGTHQGYLPVGDYRFGGIPFRVERSDDIVSVTLERGAKRNRATATAVGAEIGSDPQAPPRGAPSSGNAVPRLGMTLAVLAGGGTTTAARAGVHPLPASGVTPGLTVSGQLALSGPWFLEAGLGYRGLLASRADGLGRQVLHLAVAHTRLGWKDEDWGGGVGPMVARGVGRATGVDARALAACTETARCGAQPPSLSAADAGAVSLTGTVGAGGATLGVERRLVPSLADIGIGFEGGWLFDGQRSLLWAGLQATFEWRPTP